MMIRNNRGWALPVVIITVTIMVILSVALISNIMQSYHFANSQDNIGDTYFAGEGALEKWFNTLSNEAEIDLSVSYSGDADMSVSDNVRDYAEWLVSKVKDSLQDKLELDIEGTSDKAIVEIDDVKIMGYRIDSSTDEIVITVGIQALARYSRPSSRYKAYDKKVYGQMELRFKLPEDPSFKLLGPVYSFGDFMVNNSETDIKGDVYVFGSYPDKILQPQQWYYGGIFALNKANLTIDGNAYSRSFIRTGKYLQDNDESWIQIKKDAICQSIQLFGDGDRVLVYRNAYTFDDLEVNGEDSVIGINGSFIGLNRGRSFHDDSSAIVNSAPIHNLLSDASLLSRIIINGDVLNRGGTFKIDEEGGSVGEGFGQIEDASLAWDNSGGFGGNAYYKTRNYAGDIDYFLAGYHEDLRYDYYTLGNVTGFLNLFQVWDVKSRNNVGSWFTDKALAARGRDGNPRGNKLNEFYVDNVPSAISGYWDFEIAANDRLYMKVINTGDGYSDMVAINHLNDNFVLDNIYSSDNKNILKYGNGTWSGMATSFDLSEATGLMEYKNALNNLIEGVNAEDGNNGGIKGDLLKLTHFFAERKYPESAVKGSSWFAQANKSFNETLDLLRSLAVRNPDNEYILYVPSKDSGIYDIDLFYSEVYPGETLYDQRGLTYDTDTKYYLIINSDPGVTLAVSGEFNGIIFTAGKVHLKDGADIRGAIVAAGMLDINGDPDVNRIRITEDNVDDLNEGKFASIYSDGKDVKIDFYLGLKPRELVKLDEDSTIIEGDFGALDTTESVTAQEIGEGNDFLSREARKRLLKKFSELDIDLTDIF